MTHNTKTFAMHVTFSVLSGTGHDTGNGSSGEVGDLIDKMPEKFQKFCQGIRSPAC